MHCCTDYNTQASPPATFQARTELNQLGLFAKFWQPGTVKTRLAASIGNQAACEVYHGFVFQLVSALADSANRREVVFSPIDRESDFRRDIPMNWELHPQSTGELGIRMKTFFEDAFQHDNSDFPKKVVIIGADCPQLGSSEIAEAFAMLDAAPVVLGPSTDGGYYLIGMRDSCVDVFQNIEWSTASVLSETKKQLAEMQVEYRLLPEQTDVDDFEGLVALANQSNLKTFDAALVAKIQSVIETGPVPQ